MGVVQPPVIAPEPNGGNGYIINAGRRRVRQAIAAGLEEIDALVDEAANDNGAMRSMVENIAREPLSVTPFASSAKPVSLPLTGMRCALRPGPP